ncbi:ATP-dependent DNA helicase [Ideonella azotifigens]|uniref:Helicase C-terminal domain-containing protein n=1 Tax=Ideonella azotifigens TaxID=513160 RepID=A0ABN1KGV2_9BURK|nr:ATP-dependent DNA helicase [Ideonella azotifigens]MCD2340327.1 ATP-dependent DNA helicase [Ideonella azotifigens]
MIYTVAVRELCEFTAKQGDLDLRFTPAPTAAEGIAGHALVAGRRGEGYEAEVSLSGQYEQAGVTLQVRGRADGFDARRQRLEEIKTHKTRLELQPDSHRQLHWAQLKVYGWLLCAQQGLAELELALVYLHIGSQQETVLLQRCSAAELRQHFELHCQRFLLWAQAQLAHRAARDAALQSLSFPFGEFRRGQRPLAKAVYQTAAASGCLLAQAPTGIGKTLGTLFPLLKAAPTQQLDKVFFLSAKTSGRALALQALRALSPTKEVPESPPLRVLELVARDKVCEHPGQACHGEACPLAKGFYDRLPAARTAAVAEAGLLDQARVRSVAQQHAVCPYYLSQELARWVDVVVGDYNYYFDSSALLHHLTQANQWRVALLVDEAHNLVERGRKMYTAELQPLTLAQARRSPATKARAPLKRVLDKLRRCWAALDTPEAEDYRCLATPPQPLLDALQQATSVLNDHFAEHAAESDAALQAFYFEALHFTRLAESMDSHSLFDLTRQRGAAAPRGGPASLLCLRNLLPAPFLAPRFAAAHCSTLFSATLQPARYYGDLLGLPEDHRFIDVEAPFEAAQLQVQVARHISTRYPHRQSSLQPIASLIARQYAERPGNYLAFFSSYDYLQQVAELLAAQQPELPQWQQTRQMSEAAQHDFLARFTEAGQGIGFAVLGGSFSEGIDLPGRRLIGAFVATLGLPQVNPVNEQFRHRLQTLFGAGYDYAYLYPGLQKVVQAAGRVIRTPEDQGVVHLIDDRFARREVQALLPGWWSRAAASQA